VLPSNPPLGEDIVRREVSGVLRLYHDVGATALITFSGLPNLLTAGNVLSATENKFFNQTTVLICSHL